MQLSKSLCIASLLGCTTVLAQQTAVQPMIQNYTYAVVVSQATYQKTDWKAVVDALIQKHNRISAKVFIYQNTPTDVLDSLSKMMPTYVAWVAQPVVESNQTKISEFSALMRRLDQDPYVDAIWSVVTGYQASDALRAVNDRIEVKTMIWASGGGNEDVQQSPLRYFSQGLGMDPDSHTQTTYSFPDGTILKDNSSHPENSMDRTPLIAKWLNASSINIQVPGRPSITGPVDAIQTGGHGFEQGWQAHYPDQGSEGFMQSQNGQLSVSTYNGQSIPINVPTPKVYFATNNCLIGNPNNINNMVYAWFHTGRAVNMHGFMPLASTGNDFMSWGPYNRYTKFNGKYNLPESFYYAQVGTTFEIKYPTGNYVMGVHTDASGEHWGVDYYLDQTVVYGDPKADAYVYSYGDQTHAYKESLTMTPNAKGDSANFVYTVDAANESMVGNYWFYYQMRPMHFLPQRIEANSVQILNNPAGKAEITDNFVMWELVAPNTTLAKGQKRSLSFKAKLIPNTPLNIITPVQKPAINDVPRIQILNVSAEKMEVLSSGNYEVSIYQADGTLHQKVHGEGSKTLSFAKTLHQGTWFFLIQAGPMTQKWTLTVP